MIHPYQIHSCSIHTCTNHAPVNDIQLLRIVTKKDSASIMSGVPNWVTVDHDATSKSWTMRLLWLSASSEMAPKENKRPMAIYIFDSSLVACGKKFAEFAAQALGVVTIRHICKKTLVSSSNYISQDKDGCVFKVGRT
jgi:hypothetical protein